MGIGSQKQLLVSKITLGKILLRAKSGFLAVGIFSLFLNLLMLTAPLYMLQVFDRVLSSHSRDTLFWLTIIAIAAFIILSLLDVIRNRILGGIGTWLESSLGSILVRAGLYRAAIHSARIPPSNSLRDLSLIRNFLSGNGTLALLDIPWSPFFIAVIYMLHPWLGMMAVSGIVTLVLLTILSELSARKHLHESGTDLARLYTTVDSATHTADALVSMGALDRIINLWKNASHLLLESTQTANGKLASAAAISKFVRLSLQVLIMGLGALLVIKEELTPGGMIAASIILTRALTPIELLIGAWRAFVGCRGAMKRVVNQLNELDDAHRKVTLPQPQGIVEADKVSYALPKENRFLFRDISFKLNPGEVLGIIGPSGSGKSTLARILVGLLAPTTGHARIDGSDIAHWDLEQMGQYIGYLPQGFELFEGTIRQNIARFSAAPIEEVVEIAKLAGVHDFVVRLPDGYETAIGRNSVFLSGGQQQRIALARALFGAPSVIVMDEPNANLDPAGETALLEAIQLLQQQGKTIILIAHRSNIIRSADHILMMHEGSGKLASRKKPVKVSKTLGPSYQYVDDVVKKQPAETLASRKTQAKQTNLNQPTSKNGAAQKGVEP